MEKYIRLNGLVTQGYEVTVSVEGTTADYMAAFLAIFNNVRENKECLVDIKNYSWNNDISVCCVEGDFDSLEDAKDKLEKFLSQFGSLKSSNKVLICIPEDPCYDYDYDEYDDFILSSNME